MFQKILSTFIVKILSAAMSFVLLVLATQYLGASGRGTISLIVASVGIITLINGFVGGYSLVYLIPKNKSKAFLMRVIIISYLWAFVVAVLVCAMLWLSGSVNIGLIFHVFVLGVLSAIVTVNAVILLSLKKINIYNLSNLLQVTLNCLLFLCAIVLFDMASVGTFLISLYLSYFVSISLTLVVLFNEWKVIDSSGGAVDILLVFKEIVKYGSVAQLGNVIQYLNYRLSFFVLNFYFGANVVGIYSVGVTLAEAVWLVSGSIAMVQYSNIANTEDFGYSREITLRLSKFSFVATILVVLVILSFPSVLFGMIFGKDFANVKEIVIYLLPGIAIFGLTVIISHYFAGIGRYAVNTVAAFIGLIVTVVLNFLLIPKYGCNGAAMAATISYLATGFFLVAIFLKETNYSAGEMLVNKKDIVFAMNKLRCHK